MPAEPSAPQQITWKEGDQVDLKLVDYSASGFLDPQGVLRDGRMENGVLRGTAAGEIGDRLMFLKSGGDACPFWTPLTVHIESRQPAVKKIWSAPLVKAKDLSVWTLVDLNKTFTASVTDVLGKVAQASQPPAPPACGINHNYWKDHLVGSHTGDKAPSDAAWRKRIGPDGIGWTYDGIPFKSPQQGENIAVVTRAGGFPSKIEVPVNACGRELYFMVGGVTFPMQSHVVNLRIILHYSDGGK